MREPTEHVGLMCDKQATDSESTCSHGRIVRTFVRYDREDDFADDQLAEFLNSKDGEGLAVEAMTGDRGCLIVVLRAEKGEDLSP